MYKPLFFLLLLCTGIAKAQPSVSVAPSRLFYSFPAGQSSTQDIRILNPGKSAMVFSITLADWQRDSLGDKHYFRPDSLHNSCAGWIELPYSSITLQAGEERNIPVKLLAPTDAGNTVRNAMVFLTQAEDDESIRVQKKNGASMVVRLEVGVHVYYTPPTLSKKSIDIINFRDGGWKKTGDSSKHMLEVVFKNTGELMAESHVKLELTNQATAEEIKLDAQPAPTMPGVTRVVQFGLPANLKKGNYLAVAIVDNGPEIPLRIGELEFDHQ
ncbi:DUF4832 domain-containing protein [Chitinophaga sedimenti]|uniref:DUF4832 domain-containing protein n=1 Tax=Chitinophaga sedimenti TaxID=2033606 RepID=UPI0020056614|nr:DUF4832 domain-containing protein [Chitinophaga sedimenti]MCK7559101.1 DUF4832 domain-containing protein [Chitinophaga sedimenti]